MARKLCINREYKIRISQFSYPIIFVARTMKFLEVVTPQYIYQADYILKQIYVAYYITPSAGVLTNMF